MIEVEISMRKTKNPGLILMLLLPGLNDWSELDCKSYSKNFF